MKMDVGTLKVHLCAWTVMSLLIGVFSHGVTVKNFQLQKCKENERVCVTAPADCDPRPLSSVQKTLNMSCYYQKTDAQRSMTCDWSLDSNSDGESTASLIFSSEREIISCEGIFNPVAILNVTAKIKNHTTEIWSQPHTVFLYEAVKPLQPVLTVLSATEDSMVVCWRSIGDGSCRLRYRTKDKSKWTQVPDSISAFADQIMTYTMKNLLPFTIYRAAVACRGDTGIWSDWSSEIRGTTLDRVPSRPPEVCYRLERSGGLLQLHLIMWKAPEALEAGGRILGYQISYEVGGLIQNVTDMTALLVVEEGNCSIAVKAFNTAGYGPVAHLSFDTQIQKTLVITSLPSIRDLWVSSSYPGKKELLVQWKTPIAPGYTLPVSHFAIRWHSETSPSTSHWSRVDGFTTSTPIQDVDPDNVYLISVFPVYNQQCGSPLSLLASLQQGALMEAVNLRVVSVTKTSVTIVWVWQRKSEPIRVSRYAAILRKDSDKQTLPLWPNNRQHTFTNLVPNTEYSLVLLADNVSRSIVHVTTHFNEVPVVATATPLLLLAVAVLILSILSRTVYKSYFFPPISSPRQSKTGQWLMELNQQKFAEKNILNIKDFQVTDVLRDKSLIVVDSNSQISPDDKQHEDASLLLISGLKLDSEYVSYSGHPTENQLVPIQASPIRVFMSEESREGDFALLHEAKSSLHQRDEARNQAGKSEISHQTEATVKSHFPGFLTESRPVYQMTCEMEYVVKQGRQSECSYLICEPGYITNNHSEEKTAD
ncbi:interleukin-6 receptor subunit beta [Archocentrus centrarchus]|uniref:interleukin-6 receptor subunit beta n=1 Tax=Archocentrus centrarchus TaxID=63155 RepID=UPI0011EA20DF|nr:interleukin-6 receptor subunit beta-like [Archocentrus centrarchus]